MKLIVKIRIGFYKQALDKLIQVSQNKFSQQQNSQNFEEESYQVNEPMNIMKILFLTKLMKMFFTVMKRNYNLNLMKKNPIMKLGNLLFLESSTSNGGKLSLSESDEDETASLDEENSELLEDDENVVEEEQAVAEEPVVEEEQVAEEEEVVEEQEEVVEVQEEVVEEQEEVAGEEQEEVAEEEQEELLKSKKKLWRLLWRNEEEVLMRKL